MRALEIFEDRNKKYSAKRVWGGIGAGVALAMAASKIFIAAPNASETLILGVLTASFGLLGASMAEKRNA